MLCTAALAAHLQGTVTGAWSGSVIVKHDGKAEEDFVHVALKQDGEALSGTAGPDADNQYRISKGRVTTVDRTTSVTFEYISNGVHSAFSLKLVDGMLKGEARIEGEDGRPHTATVELKRHARADAPARELR